MKNYVLLAALLIGGALYATLVNGDAIVAQDAITVARMAFEWAFKLFVSALTFVVIAIVVLGIIKSSFTTTNKEA